MEKSLVAALLAATATIALGSMSAEALPSANGAFTMAPTIGSGFTTVNTGNITNTTSSRTVPSWTVNNVTPNLTLALAPGDAGVFSSITLHIPNGVGAPEAVNFSLTVASLVFGFDEGTTDSRVALNLATNTAGSFADQYTGTLLNGGGIFAEGTPVNLSETCTQPAVGHHAGLISCTNSVITIGETTVPEPSTLALLSGSLGLVGFIYRRNRKGSNLV